MPYLRRSLIAAALLIGAAAPARAQTMPADSLAWSRQLTDWFFSGMADSVHAHMAVGEQRASPDKIREHLEQIVARAGAETEVVEEKFVKRNGNTQYWRTAKFSQYTDEPLLFRWAFNKSGQIVGVGFGPVSQAPPIDPK